MESETLRRTISETLPCAIRIPTTDTEYEVYRAYSDRMKGWRQKTLDWAMAVLPASVSLADGEVFFTRSTIRNAIAHGRGKLKLLTIPHLPQMLQQGVLFYSEPEGNCMFFNYAHRVSFEDRKYYAIIVVRQDINGKRFYDNEFLEELKATDGEDCSAGSAGQAADDLTHPSVASILYSLMNVKATS